MRSLKVNDINYNKIEDDSNISYYTEKRKPQKHRIIKSLDFQSVTLQTSWTPFDVILPSSSGDMAEMKQL